MGGRLGLRLLLLLCEQSIQKEWDRYVDDVFSIMKKDAVSTFHDELNSIDPHISFTIEHETDGQIAFLDTLVLIISRNSGTITTNVYRKPTHTDRYLDFKSHHDKKHKIRTSVTLLHRATNTPNTAESKAIETKKVFEALMSSGYPRKFITDVQKRQRKTDMILESEELVREFFALVDPPTTHWIRCPALYKGLNRTTHPSSTEV